MIWGCAEKSWDEVWRADKSAEEVWGELRRCEKREEEMRRCKMSWHELRRAEKSWEELRREAEVKRDKQSSNDMRREENRRNQLRRGENGREDMRGDEVRCGEKSWEDMRWVKMRWDDTDCGDRGMQWTISKRSCNAMRSEEMRKDSTFKKHGIRLIVVTCLSPIGTAFAPLYRLSGFQIWNFRPRLARELLACIKKMHFIGTFLRYSWGGTLSDKATSRIKG